MPTHECPFCGADFPTAGDLRTHTWEQHGGCHYCGAEVDDSEQRNLYRHWLVSHPNDLSQVDTSRAEDAIDSIGFGERLSEGGVGAAMAGIPRRAVLVGGGVVTVGGVGAGLVALADSFTGSSISTEKPGVVGTAPTPSSPSNYRYAVMGTDSASVTITYFGNYKCPICRQFDERFFHTLISEYVTTGDIRIRFRDVAYLGGQPFLGKDAPNAGHAGLEVWHTDPGSYWRFHEVVFRHQPPEGRRWATPKKLKAFAAAAGVSDPGAVKQAVKANKYESELKDTAKAAAQAGIRGTPSLLVDGTVVSPTSSPSKTRSLIEDAISNA
ncbi:MAG: DsbA family protein [Halorientalis sp.]